MRKKYICIGGEGLCELACSIISHFFCFLVQVSEIYDAFVNYTFIYTHTHTHTHTENPHRENPMQRLHNTLCRFIVKNTMLLESTIKSYPVHLPVHPYCVSPVYSFYSAPVHCTTHTPIQLVPSIVSECGKACIYSIVLTVVRRVAFSQSAQSCPLDLSLSPSLSLSLPFYLRVYLFLSLFLLRSLLWTHSRHGKHTLHSVIPLC